MSIYLIRHASAGHRHRWAGPDKTRPLDRTGRAQAEMFVRLYADVTPKRFLSSPATRCIETIEPWAAACDSTVEPDERLFEGRGGEVIFELLRELGDEDAVLCSHGDVIPGIIWMLRGRKILPEGPMPCAKGSTWHLETIEGSIVAGTYLPPPPVR